MIDKYSLTNNLLLTYSSIKFSIIYGKGLDWVIMYRRCSAEEGLAIRREQNFQCAICQRSESELGRELFIDHDHQTERTRGALCGSCNTLLGGYQDSALRIRARARRIEFIRHKLLRAAVYLDRAKTNAIELPPNLSAQHELPAKPPPPPLALDERREDRVRREALALVPGTICSVTTFRIRCQDRHLLLALVKEGVLRRFGQHIFNKI